MYWPQIYQYPQNEYIQNSCGNGQAFFNQPQSALPLSTSMGNSQARGLRSHNQSIDINYISQVNPLASFRTSARSHQHTIPSNHCMGHTSLKGTKISAANLGIYDLSQGVQNYQRTVHESISRVDTSMLSRSSLNASKVVEMKLKATLDARRQKHASTYAGQSKDRDVSGNKHILFGSNHGFNDVKNNHAMRQSQTSSFLESNFTDAKFFIIKSYSEDNVYKSIKFNVWASTACGNKKLDEAFKDAQCQAEANGFGCPIFLFFSVCISTSFIL